jgi:hypothetical protein
MFQASASKYLKDRASVGCPKIKAIKFKQRNLALSDDGRGRDEDNKR